jgi:hypothetical protein
MGDLQDPTRKTSVSLPTVGEKVPDATAEFSPRSKPLSGRFPHEVLGMLLGAYCRPKEKGLREYR